MFCEDKKCPVYIECMERLDALPYCASKAAELATTANQQLKAEIAVCIDRYLSEIIGAPQNKKARVVRAGELDR